MSEQPARDVARSSEKTPCWMCGAPARYKVREEGCEQTYHLCVKDYRLAIGLGELLKDRK